MLYGLPGFVFLLFLFDLSTCFNGLHCEHSWPSNHLQPGRLTMSRVDLPVQGRTGLEMWSVEASKNNREKKTLLCHMSTKSNELLTCFIFHGSTGTVLLLLKLKVWRELFLAISGHLHGTGRLRPPSLNRKGMEHDLPSDRVEPCQNESQEVVALM